MIFIICLEDLVKNIYDRVLNTDIDFRARLRFPRAAVEPPDMNKTVKTGAPHSVLNDFCPLLRSEALTASFETLL
jgi:hypothetical protein